LRKSLRVDSELVCRAILFDLDGVLVDSAERVEKTWREWAARHRLDAELVIAAAHGRRTVETVALVAPGLSADDELRALETSEATNSDGVYEIAGARDLLQLLPPRRWAVVTSGIRAVAEFRIRYTGLPTPAVMICAEDISRGKPDPEGYLAAAGRLGFSPADCVVIEDAPPGIEAAKAAGMRAIGIATTYPSERLVGADLVVGQLTDLGVESLGDEIHIACSTNPSNRR
jgi:mannitol-1-/sugar-/sorbitol-6-phosphatase